MPKIQTQLSTIPLAGPLFMLASALLFTVHNGFIKMIGSSFSAWDIAFYRFGCGLVILIAIFGWRSNPFRGHNLGLLIIRGITGSIAFLSLITVIRHIPLATALVLFYAFPAFAAFFSQRLFGEKILRTEILFIVKAGRAAFI
ncbi:MAG: EamA family transporter [Planctomycetota bacterium]|jgi:drug/metabolite transporter (DMT)-like permease